jgi:hypothetical protein
MFVMELLDRLKRVARLAGIVGAACTGVVLSYCSGSTVKVDGPPRDRARTDLPRDAAVPDARRDASVADARSDIAVKTDLRSDATPDKKPKIDQRLWDVLCE